jgi:hypothetical protein
MFLGKLGLLTCGFYVGLVLLLEAGVWAVIRHRGGFGVLFYSGKHPGLGLGLFLGIVFGFLWLVSFIAAWWIVWPNFKATLSRFGA